MFLKALIQCHPLVKVSKVVYYHSKKTKQNTGSCNPCKVLGKWFFASGFISQGNNVSNCRYKHSELSKTNQVSTQKKKKNKNQKKPQSSPNRTWVRYRHYDPVPQVNHQDRINKPIEPSFSQKKAEPRPNEIFSFYSFLYSLNLLIKYILIICYVLGNVLNAEDIMGNKVGMCLPSSY